MSTKKAADQSAKKTTKSQSRTSRASKKAEAAQGAGSTTPLGEPVTRYEMLGACNFVLVDPGERIDAKARQALLDSHQGHFAECTIQCAGYVFNLTMLPKVVLVDKDGKVTRSPESGTPGSDAASKREQK